MTGPNDTVRVAVLGVNGRGRDHIGGFAGLKNVQVAILCDPGYSRPVKTETDLRRVFDDQTIDAVSVATPNRQPCRRQFRS